jgi:hypothetical protein
MRVLLAASLAFFGGCSSLLHAPDRLCAEIATFANSTARGASQSVVLWTDWGGQFSSEELLHEKSCKHDDTGSGRQLCEYLLENTSTELPELNFRRALRCLSPRVQYTAERLGDLQFRSATVASESAKGVRDALVTVELDTTSAGQPPSLKITAARKRST